jgi:hypothetical protein
MVASVAISAGDLDGLEIDGTVMMELHIPCKYSTSGANKPLKEAPLKECLRDHARLANLGYTANKLLARLKFLLVELEENYFCLQNC